MDTVTDTISPLLPAPTSRPEMLRAVEISTTSITIAWDAVNCTERNSNITGYVVRYTPSSTSGNDSVMVAGRGDAGGMVTIDGLTPSTQFSIQVAAVNRDGSVGVQTTSLSVNTLSSGELHMPVLQSSGMMCPYFLHFWREFIKGKAMLVSIPTGNGKSLCCSGMSAS